MYDYYIYQGNVAPDNADFLIFLKYSLTVQNEKSETGIHAHYKAMLFFCHSLGSSQKEVMPSSNLLLQTANTLEHCTPHEEEEGIPAAVLSPTCMCRELADA